MSQNKKFFGIILIMILFLFIYGLGLLSARSTLVSQSAGSHQDPPVDAEKTSALSPDEMSKMKQDPILLIYDPQSTQSGGLKGNVEKTLDYMKKPYETVEVPELPVDMEKYPNIVILFPDLEKINDITSLTDYVAEGGRLFFAIRPDTDENFYSIQEKLGIKEPDPDYKDTRTIHMVSDLMLQSANMKLNDKNQFPNSVLDISLEEECKVYALTDGEIPFLWSRPYGKGKFMVFNGTMLDNKMNRGMIAGALSHLNELFIYPVINSKVVYIDDFPAPFPDGTHKLIYEDYQVDIPVFMNEIWWPKMLQLAKKYDIKYTAVMIETYNDKVTGPFNERLAEENLMIYGRDVLNTGGELGVHGYNHQSLTLDQDQVEELGYNAWNDKSVMVQSLKEVEALVHTTFPDYTLKTYVPPSNVLSEEGKQAIKEAIPSIANIGSLYLEDEENIAYIQELQSTEEFNEIPRFTSDYHYKDETRWSITNSATLFGSFSHFIHPDDILDEERSEDKGWPELSEEFRHLLRDVKEKYPWMVSQTASESSYSLKNYLGAKVAFSQGGDQLKGYINEFPGKLDFILRTDTAIVESEGCIVQKIDSSRYLVRAVASKFTIELGE